MRRERIRWPRTIKDFCESSPFRLWPNYLPDIAAMENIQNRICYSHDYIHRRRFFSLSLFPFIDDQRRGLFDSNGMLLCKLVFCAKNARFFFSPPGEMSQTLISEALPRRLREWRKRQGDDTIDGERSKDSCPTKRSNEFAKDINLSSVLVCTHWKRFDLSWSSIGIDVWIKVSKKLN